MPAPQTHAMILLAWAAAASAAQPSPADLARVNRSLNPTPTPNLYGTESRIHTDDLSIDAKGNRLFTDPTPAAGPPDNTEHRVAARVKPCPAFRPLWTQAHDFEAQIDSYERADVISRKRANAFRERLALLRMKYGLARKPDGSELSRGQIKGMGAELAAMKKELLP